MTLYICGYAVLIDNDDAERVLSLKWGLKERKQTRDGLVYFRSSYWQDGKAKSIYLHRFILNAPHGTIVDHINGNTLDNRRSNLRLVSVQDNTRNRKMDRRNKSGYRGVIFSYGKWRAYIRVDGKHVSLGRFDNKMEAAMAYNKGAMKYFGEHARLNKVESAEPPEERRPEVDALLWMAEHLIGSSVATTMRGWLEEYRATGKLVVRDADGTVKESLTVAAKERQ